MILIVRVLLIEPVLWIIPVLLIVPVLAGEGIAVRVIRILIVLVAGPVGRLV